MSHISIFDMRIVLQQHQVLSRGGVVGIVAAWVAGKYEYAGNFSRNQ